MSNSAWEEVLDPVSRRTLYFNRSCGVTTFDKPDELKNSEERKRDLYLKTGIFVESGYDDLASGPSADDTIKESNVGYQLLQKMGWKEEKGLGKSEAGITVPIEPTVYEHNGGVGIEEQDEAIAAVTKDRKKLDIEIEQSETEVQQRKEIADRNDQIEADIKNMHKEFYCELCDKQYTNVKEMSVHLSSYDHHHKKRFKEMKESQKRHSDDADGEQRKKKEARRAAKEVRDRINATSSSAPISDKQSTSPPQKASDISASAKPLKFSFSKSKKGKR